MPQDKLKKQKLRILLIRFSSIGDIILTTPVIKALKENNSGVMLDYLTLLDYGSLLKDNPSINNLYLLGKKTFDHAVKEALLLRKIKYDYIFDLHRSTRSLIFRILLRSKNKYKFNKNYTKRFLLTTFKFKFYKKPYTVVTRYFNTVKALKVPAEGRTEIWLKRDEIKKALSKINKITGSNYLHAGANNEADIIDRKKIIRKGQSSRRIISFMPFAKWRTKEWSDDKFIELGQLLRDESGTLIQILGGKDDAKRAEKIVRGIGKNAISMAGKLTLPETAVALSVSACLISNDTGVMHIGGAVSIPVIAIFGSTSEELGFFPYKSSGEVVQRDLDCRPCTAKGLSACPKKHFKCMNDISADSVYLVVKKYI